MNIFKKFLTHKAPDVGPVVFFLEAEFVKNARSADINMLELLVSGLENRIQSEPNNLIIRSPLISGQIT